MTQEEKREVYCTTAYFEKHVVRKKKKRAQGKNVFLLPFATLFFSFVFFFFRLEFDDSDALTHKCRRMT